MRCPVCNALIPPLQEWCNACVSFWREGQEKCPAKLEFGEGYHEPIQCCLSFRHTQQKHKALGVAVGIGGEASILWHYPRNHPGLIRSVDYQSTVKDK